jgi:hypothetical protein
MSGRDLEDLAPLRPSRIPSGCLDALAEQNPNAAGGKATHFIDRRHEDQLTASQQSNAIAHALDFPQHMGRHEHGLAAMPCLLEQFVQ